MKINRITKKELQDENNFLKEELKMKELINLTIKDIIEKQHDVISKLADRVKMDNEKYDQLIKYIDMNFPGIIKSRDEFNETNNNLGNINESNKSEIFVDSEGNFITTKHIIDVAINIIQVLKDRIQEIRGKQGTFDDDFLDM